MPANNPIALSTTSDQVTFGFEWFGSLLIDPDMGLMFSVCDRPSNKLKFKCSDPEKMQSTAYQIALSYKRKPGLSVNFNVVILGLDIDGEPIVSTGIHSFRCMFCLFFILAFY